MLSLAQCLFFFPAATTSTSRPQEEIVRNGTTNHPQTYGNQTQSASDASQSDFNLSWNVQIPSEAAFASLSDMDLETYNDQAGDGFTPMFESLQNSFGSAVISGTIWEALEMDPNNGFLY